MKEVTVVVTGSILRASLCRVLNLELRASHEGSTLAGAALVSIQLVFVLFKCYSYAFKHSPPPPSPQPRPPNLFPACTQCSSVERFFYFPKLVISKVWLFFSRSLAFFSNSHFLKDKFPKYFVAIVQNFPPKNCWFHD